MDARAWSEISCAVCGSNNMTAIEKLTTKVIKVIGMVLVTEKYGIDMRQLIHLDCWVVMDLEWSLPRLSRPFCARRREERVGKKGDAVDFENCCGSPDMSDVHFVLEGRSSHDCRQMYLQNS